MRIGFYGDGQWANLAIELLVADSRFEIAFIIPRYNDPDPKLSAWSDYLKIPFKMTNNVNHPDISAWVSKHSPDINISMSFDQIFKDDILHSAPMGFINCHAGALPFYRGRNVINWAIINGEEEIGITVHYVDAGIDTGDIIKQKFVEVTPQDNYETVLAKAHEQCALTLIEALNEICDSNETRTVQSTIHPIGTYCPGRGAGDEWIDWQWTSRRIYNFIRGISPPAPGAQTTLRGQRIAILKSELIPNAPEYIGTCGVVVGRDTESVVVKTCDTTLRILQIGDVVSGGVIENIRKPKYKIGDRFGVSAWSSMNKSSAPLIVIGAGGHAKVLIEALRHQDREIIGIVESPGFMENQGPFGIEIIGDDNAVFAYPAATVELVNGIGSLPGSRARWAVFKTFESKGYSFATVLHPKSYLADDVELGEGCQVMAGAVVQPGTRIGRQSIVNTSASIDHDCHLGDGVHTAPGATVCGGVTVGDHAYIGAGASVIQSLSVGPNAVIGAGAVVVKDVTAGTVVKSMAAKVSGEDA